MIFNPQPKNLFKELSQGCDRECKFSQAGPSSTTAMYFAPVYDKEGNNLNPDGNITTTTYQCTECGKSWRVSEQRGEHSVILLNEEISKPNIDYSTDFEYLKDHY